MPVKAYFSSNKQFNFASDKAKQKENMKLPLPYSTYEDFLLHYYILLRCLYKILLFVVQSRRDDSS